MNKRQYPFTRARGARWLPAAQALLCVLALLAAARIFRYGHEIPVRNEQRGAVSRIEVRPNDAYSRQLDLRDPARVFGIPSGGFAAERPDLPRRRKFSAVALSAPEVPGAVAPYRAAAEHPFPVSVPFPAAEPTTTTAPVTTVVTPRGELLRLAELARADFAPSGTETRVALSSSGTLRHCRIVASCGNASADRAAARAVLAHRGGDGVYTVIWHREAVKP